MSETQRQFTAEFRDGAVRIGRPIAQVARELGINAGTLGNWVAKDRTGRGDRLRLSEDAEPAAAASGRAG